jgi:hypothetical protein
MQSLKVCCVRTGDLYGLDYVYKLKSMVSRHLTIDHEFTCYSDTEIPDIKCQPAVHHGWWGKVSVFKEQGPLLYFDLDTIIVGSIDEFAEMVINSNREIFLLKPFVARSKPRTVWLSGVMGWSGDWSFVNSAFDANRHPKRFRGGGDQDYISYILSSGGRVPVPIQDAFKGVLSYKRDEVGNELPEGAKIVCFHGKPKPNGLKKIGWVQEHWR